MPDYERGDEFKVSSPSSSSQVTKDAEKEMRKSFSDMLGEAGMDSFMGSIGNFMTDEEFFEMNDMDVFKEMYDEYQKTPAGAQKKESAARLFESFSDLFTQTKNSSQKDLQNHFQGDERLAKVRKELNLQEVDDEQSKVTTAETSVDSFAQESTISDYSAYQRGIKLANLGANPLGVSVSTDTFFSDDGESVPEEDVLPADSSSNQKANDDKSFRQRRTLTLNESRSRMSQIPETPRNRGRRGPSAGDATDSVRSSMRSSRIIMTPLKESRSSSRGRARTPSRRSRDMSASPSRSFEAGLDSNRNRARTPSRRTREMPARSPSRSPSPDAVGSKEETLHSRKSPAETPDRQRRSMEYYSSPRRSPMKSPRKQARSQSPRHPNGSPRRRTRSHSPGPSYRSPRKEARRKDALQSPTTPRRFARPPQTSRQDMAGQSAYDNLSAFGSTERQERNKLPGPRNEARTKPEKQVQKQGPLVYADESSEMVSVAEKSADPSEGPNIWEGVTDSTIIPPRSKVASKLHMPRRSHEMRSSRTDDREKGAESQQRQSGSNSMPVPRRRGDGPNGGGDEVEEMKSPSRLRRSFHRRVEDRDADTSVDLSVEEFHVGMDERRRRSPCRSMRGSRRYGPSEPETVAPGDSANANLEARPSKSARTSASSRSRGTHRTSSDSELQALANRPKDYDGDSANESARKSPTRSRRGARRSVSSDDILSSSIRSRTRRPPRDPAGSRHSVESHGSISAMSASESMVSGTEFSSETPSDHVTRPVGGRSRPEGRDLRERGRRRSHSMGPSSRRSRSISSRSPSRERPREPMTPRGSRGTVPGNSRGTRTPTRNRRELSTPSASKTRVTRIEALAAMRARKVTPSTPQPTARLAVGMARVKELNNRKTRSSSAPRGRRAFDERDRPAVCLENGNRRHLSSSGAIDELKKFRRANGVATEDDIASGHRRVQTSELSNGLTLKKTTTKNRTAETSPASSSERKKSTGRRQKIDRRAILVTEFPREKDGVGVAEAPIAI